VSARPGDPTVSDTTQAPKRITILPGQYHAAKRPVVIETLLGSCVAACLYDPVNHVVGMNHFLLSSDSYANSEILCVTEAGRYGVHAMELLINDMLHLGANRAHLQAKVFGGGSFFTSTPARDTFLDVGEVNCRFILEFLAKDGIPLMASDLGGDTGRRIWFASSDYSVLVRKTRPKRVSGILKQERHWWHQSLDDRKGPVPEPDLWR